MTKPTNELTIHLRHRKKAQPTASRLHGRVIENKLFDGIYTDLNPTVGAKRLVTLYY